jgi:hypothetical protein
LKKKKGSSVDGLPEDGARIRRCVQPAATRDLARVGREAQTIVSANALAHYHRARRKDLATQ